jgi:DNA-binding MarR family transcriptional regulator
MHDRRGRLARLTDKGEALIDEVMPLHKERVVAFFANLNFEEVQQLRELLKKLRGNPAVVPSEDEDTALYHSLFVNKG